MLKRNLQCLEERSEKEKLQDCVKVKFSSENFVSVVIFLSLFFKKQNKTKGSFWDSDNKWGHVQIILHPDDISNGLWSSSTLPFDLPMSNLSISSFPYISLIRTFFPSYLPPNGRIIALTD